MNYSMQKLPALFVTLTRLIVCAFPLLFGVARAELAGSTRIATGLSNPIVITHAPGDSSRLFIGERGGSIRVFDLTSGTLLSDDFLDPIPDVNTEAESGFLGLTFHPNYQENGKFYVNVTLNNDGPTFQGKVSKTTTHILEYTVSPTNPNDAIEEPREILSYVQPDTTHNAGWMGFSPINGYLYINTGDGGGAWDSGDGHTPIIGNAQDLYLEDDGTGEPARNLLGKILRIDVDGDDFPDEDDRNYAVPNDNPFVGGETIFDDEIWAYGVRNPFRGSFDRKTGDLWFGDVGQASREEINWLSADSSGGENYGWSYREGTLGGDPPAGLTEPVYDYERSGSDLAGRSVTGGYVYRGPDPTLRGQYIFTDFVSNNIVRFDPSDPYDTAENINDEVMQSNGVHRVATFGEDADGNLYAAHLISGFLFRIDTDIMLAGDYSGNGVVDAADYALWKSDFGAAGVFAADGSGDGKVDLADYTMWRDNFGRQLHQYTSSAAASTAASVPEPSALATAAAAAGLLYLCQRQLRPAVIRRR